MIARIIWLIIVVWLGACAITPPTSTAPLWSFNGKFSLRSEQKNQSAYIQWQQFEAAYVLRLWGTLGLGTTKIDGNATRILVDTGKQRQVLSSSESVELLAGLSLPLGSITGATQALLRRCELGVQKPLPSSSEWHFTCARATTVNGMKLPEKIRISDGSTTLILLIKAWN